MNKCVVARASNRKFLPRLELLEARDCPAAPSIIGAAYESDQHQFTLTGHVTDESPGGLTVQITGAYTGSVVTDSSGDFLLHFAPSQLGIIDFTVTDNENLTSSPGTAIVMSMAPNIVEFGASRTINNIWTFSGRVSDEHAAGLTVTLGGLTQLQGVTVIVQSNGTFSYTIDMGENFLGGTATAQTTDWWGLQSNEASYFVFPSV